jgi:hypothetical protein
MIRMRKSRNLPPLLLLLLGSGILGAQGPQSWRRWTNEPDLNETRARAPGVGKMTSSDEFVIDSNDTPGGEMYAGRGLGRLFFRSINRHAIGVRGVHSEAMLVRDFVARSLYQKDKGYFTSRTVVGSVGGWERGSSEYGLDFGNMLGKREYQVALLLKP